MSLQELKPSLSFQAFAYILSISIIDLNRN